VTPAAALPAAPVTACSTQAQGDGLVPVLQLAVPATAALYGQTPAYSFDDTAALAAGFDRVGYCLETSSGGGQKWVWAAMEAFTDDPGRLGLPTLAGQVTRQRVDDLTVDSNVAAVRVGAHQTGYLEMWPYLYGTETSHQVGGASGGVYDADDRPVTGGGYGSFQVHAVGDQPDSGTTASTVLALNRFAYDGATPIDIGIGPAPGTHPDWTFAQNGGSFSARTLTVYARPATVDVTAHPDDRQLFPRDVANGADVPVAGTVTDPAVDLVRLTVTSPGHSTVSQQGGPSFSFTPRIEAGLHDYDLLLETITDGAARTVGHWTHVVSGDAYFVQGQSNAQSAPYVSTGSTVAESPFIRSYGTNSPDVALSGADRAWNYAGGDLEWEMSSVGQWPLEMAHDLVRTEEVPVAVINGAHGGQPVGFFQRNDAAPGDLSTNYGRVRQRLVASGLAKHLSGVFYYQGESDGEDAVTHVAGVRSLLADWHTDLGGARAAQPPYYLFQVRTQGCFQWNLGGVGLREAQRRLGQTDGVTVLSTTAVPGHDGCHFSWPGYQKLGDQVADTVRRDVFGGPTAGVAAPDPVSAEFTNPDADALVVQLASTTDPLTVGDGVAADFKLVGSDATVTGIHYLDGGRLGFTLSRPAPEATGLSYYAHLGDSPYITTTRGVGLLAFRDLPIANAPVNLALGSTTLSSTPFSADTTASNAVDDNTGTLFASAVPSGWWEVDLGHRFNLSVAQLVFRSDGYDDPHERKNLEFWVSTDADMSQGRTVACTIGSAPQSYGATYSCPMPDGPWRYVAVKKTDSYGLALSEVRVFGTPGVRAIQDGVPVTAPGSTGSTTFDPEPQGDVLWVRFDPPAHVSITGANGCPEASSLPTGATFVCRSGAQTFDEPITLTYLVDANARSGLSLKGSVRVGQVHNTIAVDAFAVNTSEPVTPTAGPGPQVAATKVTAVHLDEPSAFGQRSSVAVTVSRESSTGAAPVGTVTVTDPVGNAIVSGQLVDGAATLALPATLPVGTHALIAKYAGTEALAASQAPVSVTVTKASTTTTARTRKRHAFGRDFTVKVAVTAAGVVPTGRVRITYRGKVIGRAAIAAGEATVRIKKDLGIGKAALVVTYPGSPTTLPSRRAIRLKILEQ
jgi:hypothetical protein